LDHPVGRREGGIRRKEGRGKESRNYGELVPSLLWDKRHDLIWII